MMQNRRQRRSNVLMAAALELSGHSLSVKLRNLSKDGALVEGDPLPVEGSEVRFRRGDLAVSGRLIWVRGNRAGIQFTEQLSSEAVLRHVPPPRPRVVHEYRRPGLRPRPLTDGERRLGDLWIVKTGPDSPGE